MYDALAPVYDNLNKHADYRSTANYLFGLLKECGISGGILLDLACGTGTLSFLASEAGYDVIGVDCSTEMLAVANMKCRKGKSPIFICQDMRELDLYGTVRACICTLDAINHITKRDELSEVFRRVSLFCEPGGMFIFDINSPFKFKSIDGCAFADEDDNSFVVWSAAKSGESIYQFIVDVFTRSGQLYRRKTDVFCERAYDVEELCIMLDSAGFDVTGVYGDRTKTPPSAEEHRIYVAARRRE